MERICDVVVIGAGHNGLASAAYLAKAGLETIVVEEKDEIGGGTTTKEVTAPGFKHNVQSCMHSWLLSSPVYSDLELEKLGVSYVFPDPQYAMVFRDGRSIILHMSVDKTCESIARFSPRDASTYRTLYEQFRGLKQIVLGSWSVPPAPPSALYAALENDDDGMELIRMVLADCRTVVEDYFENDLVRTFILGLTNLVTPQDLKGAGIMVPLMIAVHDQPWGICVGGSIRVALALARHLRDHGGEIVGGSAVRSIVVEGGTAVGVDLENGERIRARRGVISACGAPQTVLELLDESLLDRGTTWRARRYQWDEMVQVIPHLALRQAPRWNATDPTLKDCVFIAFGIDDADMFQTIYNDAREKRLPRNLGGVAVVPTLADPSMAPAGMHTALYWQWTTFDIQGDPNNWDAPDLRQELMSRMLETWGRYAGNITEENIVGKYLWTPFDTSRHSRAMGRGSGQQGQMSLDQMNRLRPWIGSSDYKLPGVENLYLTGGTCHPAGGVHGFPAYNVVNTFADDHKLKKWWDR